MAIDIAPANSIDSGATQPIAKEQAHNALPISNETKREEKHRLSMRKIALDSGAMGRITHMLVARELSEDSILTRLRKSDLAHLERLADAWDAVYEPTQGAAYPVAKNLFNPHIITETSQERMARITDKLQKELKKAGMRLIYVKPREGSLSKGFTKPYMEIEYKNPFQALRMRSLLRKPAEKQRLIPTPIVQRAA